MSTNLNEGLQHLDELIRLVTGYLDPSDRYEYLNNNEEVESMKKKYPKCFLILNGVTKPDPSYLPICNRAGVIDPKVLTISMKVVANFIDNESDQYDINDMQKILNTLQRLHSRYDQDVPKPYDQAGRKGVVTRMFNNIKGYLDTTRGK